jgi:hypothetical protein
MPFDTKNASLYQDRLGTSIGKVEKTRRFCRQGQAKAVAALLAAGAENVNTPNQDGEENVCPPF